MRIRWKLRMAAAQREVWTGAPLRRLLVEKAGLSSPRDAFSTTPNALARGSGFSRIGIRRAKRVRRW
jgi:hypothetical protein